MRFDPSARALAREEPAAARSAPVGSMATRRAACTTRGSTTIVGRSCRRAAGRARGPEARAVRVDRVETTGPEAAPVPCGEGIVLGAGRERLGSTLARSMPGTIDAWHDRCLARSMPGTIDARVVDHDAANATREAHAVDVRGAHRGHAVVLLRSRGGRRAALCGWTL